MKRQISLTGLGVSNGMVRGELRTTFENGYGHNLHFRCIKATFVDDEAFKAYIEKLIKERDFNMKNDESFQLLEKYGSRVFEVDI